MFERNFLFPGSFASKVNRKKLWPAEGLSDIVVATGGQGFFLIALHCKSGLGNYNHLLIELSYLLYCLAPIYAEQSYIHQNQVDIGVALNNLYSLGTGTCCCRGSRNLIECFKQNLFKGIIIFNNENIQSGRYVDMHFRRICERHFSITFAGIRGYCKIKN